LQNFEFIRKRLSKVELQRRLQNLMEDSSSEVDLSEHVDASAMCVPVTFPLRRARLLVRGLALRHLVVVDASSSPVGLITRRDLMGSNLEERLAASTGTATTAAGVNTTTDGAVTFSIDRQMTLEVHR